MCINNSSYTPESPLLSLSLKSCNFIVVWYNKVIAKTAK